MTELQGVINDIYGRLSTISVSGDMVDVMAGIRAELRRAYKMAEEEEVTDDGG